jgi:hypothetical protein
MCVCLYNMLEADSRIIRYAHVAFGASVSQRDETIAVLARKPIRNQTYTYFNGDRPAFEAFHSQDLRQALGPEFGRARFPPSLRRPPADADLAVA